MTVPAQGSHPGESGLSALDYFMQDRATIPDDRGIFLGTTYRMHPTVNEFISRAVYEGRLDTDKGNINQVIRVPDGYQGSLNKEAGLVYLPVAHEGYCQVNQK